MNTIYDEGIWRAILAGHHDPGWQNFVSSRRGYGGPSPDILVPDNDVPSFFTNPFRPVGAAVLVPPSAGPNRLDRLEVETTLLRSTSIPYNANPNIPLLRTSRPNRTTTRNAIRISAIKASIDWETWSPHGRTSTRSGSRWVTSKWSPAPMQIRRSGSRVHPDGFRLGKELGSDAGTVKRHRAFYIIDRSIPVAFEPGENHNVDRAVLLRRFIE